MCEISECPICMDTIDVSKNCVTTECGHKFHTSCLMRNVSFNGFECPYCRTVMAEDDSEEIDYEEYVDEHVDDNDDNLPILRRLSSIVSNDELEEGEETEEETLRWIVDEESDEIDDNYPLSAEDPIPSFDLILRTLIEKNVSYEDLVKCALFGHLAFSYTEHNPEINRLNEFINNEIYDVIINYKPEEEKLAENSIYNFYFLENEYKQREHFKLIENSIENLVNIFDDVI